MSVSESGMEIACLTHFVEMKIALSNKRSTTMNIPKLGRTHVTAFILAVLGAVAFAQAAKAPVAPDHSQHGEAMQACAKACSDCQRQCDSCATHCGHQLYEGKKEHIMTLMTCQDCANVCTAAAQIVSRGGPFSALICGSCADACARCGKECDQFPADEHMKKCADECRKCEKACRDMVKHVGHGTHKDESK
jgi:hypothetical protein